MSQGIFSALTYLENLVQGITPKTDLHHGFVAINRGGGLTVSLEDRPNSTRYFELALDGLAQDDGAAGLSGRKRCRVNCRVRYDVPHDPGFMTRQINEDAADLINTLKGPQYSLATTGILSLIPYEAQLESITDAQGDRFAYILVLPFDLLYLEA
jgi:hypothetical protein|tara:strand:- start:2 stop:466 length:465 start_codon:yes stop_codon:yes gene_type:complete